MYNLELEFYADLNLQESKHHKTGRGVVMYLKKAENGPYWPRLLKVY